jgi:hypothetical protein
VARAAGPAAGSTVPGVSSAAPREGEIPFDQAPGLAELAERADRHERLRLVRGGGSPALVLMTEDDFDRAVEDAADLALCRDILSRMEPIDPAQVATRHAEFVAFLEGIADRA